MQPLREQLAVPPNQIFYFKNGKVEAVRTFTLVNQEYLADSTYRRWGDRYFEDSFDEFHGIGGAEKEVEFDSLPYVVQQIFQANTREGIGELRAEQDSRISAYVDRN